jgi:hypothetical protein
MVQLSTFANQRVEIAIIKFHYNLRVLLKFGGLATALEILNSGFCFPILICELGDSLETKL